MEGAEVAEDRANFELTQQVSHSYKFASYNSNEVRKQVKDMRTPKSLWSLCGRHGTGQHSIN